MTSSRQQSGSSIPSPLSYNEICYSFVFREEFNECTVLTIAHRIKTILDSDRVLVMENGSLSEFDRPNTLLEDVDSAFYKMSKDAGVVA